VRARRARASQTHGGGGGARTGLQKRGLPPGRPPGGGQRCRLAGLV